ncbi:MAG: hypothetical protein K2I98_01190, partial [Prevotella sp.]|nr:hypothetical protein [Prevotella sp.]
MAAALEEKWSINFTEIGANYSDKTGITIDTDNAITVGGTALGSCSANGDALDSKFLLQTGTTWMLRVANGLYQGNGGGRAFGLADCKKGQVITIETTGGAPTAGTNVTETSSGTTSVFTVNEDGPVKFNLTRYYFIKNIKIEENVVSEDQKATTYTVKFVDESGNEIKEAVTTDSYTGETATATDNNMASFVADGKKYIYKEGNTTITLVEDAAQNVITLVFREAAVYNFTATYVNDDNTEIAPAFNGSVFEGDSYSVPFSKFVLSNGVMYTKAANSNVYAQTFTPTADGQSTVITYNNANIEGVVYCKEIEDIEGMSIYGDGNAAVRASNTKVGYNANNDTELTTLPNGKYKIHAGIFDAQKNISAEFVFTAGETVVMTAKAVNANLNESDSEEFTLNSASTPIILKAGGNSLTGVDFVYIVKTGDAELEALEPAVGVMDFNKMDLLTSTSSSTDGDIEEDKTLTADEFSVTISPKESGNTNNRFWSTNNGPQLRIYNGTLTVKAAAGKTLTKIVFATGTWGTMTANVGTLDSKTWTGEATEVVFTVTKQCQINSITVGETPAEPLVDAANIAAFKALEKGTKAKLVVNGAKVTFVNDVNTYIEDETGALLLYNAGLNLTAGKALTGYINGAYTEYKGLAELTAIDETAASEFTEADTEVAATVVTVAEANAAESVSKLVKLEEVDIDAEGKLIKQGEAEINFYDKFKVMGDFVYPEYAKSIVGIITTADGVNSFCPVSPDEVAAGEKVEVVHTWDFTK